MSIRYVGLVLGGGPKQSNEAWVLTILADCANEAQGGLCFPSIELVARRARLSERQAQRIIRKLAEDDWLRIEEGGGRHQSNRYWLNVPRLVAEQDAYTPTVSSTTPGGYGPETVTSATETVTSATGKGDTHVTPTGIEPEEEPSLTEFAMLPSEVVAKRVQKAKDKRGYAFDEWWAIVPKKTAKGAAERAYRIALTKTTHDVLMQATHGLVGWNALGPYQYIPHPATWLNGERWADEAPPATRPAAGVWQPKPNKWSV